uniref:SFRICE_006471 n=1 Tax=Spodoptera frugiperda TaxID=7108 RepID=A0A2H1VD03_SPOFR
MTDIEESEKESENDQTANTPEDQLLLAMSLTTMFVSMWITNTAATTMMVPIIFALLQVFEDLDLLSTFEKDVNGDLVASDITTCYFCAASFSATIGGIGTLVGSATNLVFKGLYERPKSETAKRIKIPEVGMQAAKNAVDKNLKEIGKITFWEIVRLVNIVRDSAAAVLVCFLMLVLPSTLDFFKNFTAKVFVTNFASNVAVCTVVTPIVMQLMKIGIGPSIVTILITWAIVRKLYGNTASGELLNPQTMCACELRDHTGKCVGELRDHTENSRNESSRI